MKHSPIYNQDLLDAVTATLYFSINVPGFCGHWVDDEGKYHTADIGYVCDFLNDLKQYLGKKLYSKEKGDCNAAED